MKSIRSVVIGIFFGSGLIIGLCLLHAQENATTIQSGAALTVDWNSASDLQVMLTALESVPTMPAADATNGNTFWSAQHAPGSAEPWPPMPSATMTSHSFNVWQLSSNEYLLNDIGFDYNAKRVKTGNAATKMATLDDEGGPGVPGGGSTNSGVAETFAPIVPFSTNGLWIQTAGMGNGQIFLNLMNATDYVYKIICEPALTTPGNWSIAGEVFPTNAAVMPFTVAASSPTNLFIWAMDWTGVTDSGNTTPEWWFYYFYGTTNLSDTNLDADGNTLLSDYTYRLDPNVIEFSLNFTNDYVNSQFAPVQLSVTKGKPFYYAVLVNDTNNADAVWQPYVGSNVVAMLGSTDGTYNVYVGLRGLPANATQTWQWDTVTLYSEALALTITNPVVNAVSKSSIQLQGCANHALSSLTFDVSNAAGIFTNQTGFLTGQFYDTNLLAYTTNYFECDMNLENGTNLITLHSTDWAGSATSVSVILDYSPDTNPPVLNLVWPQDEMKISGGNFTVQAQVDDPKDSVIASINGNVVQGLVEQNGAAWVQNLPVNAGTNVVTLTASNAFGGVSVTNFNVIGNDVGLTIDPISSDQLNQSSVTVTGTIGDPVDDCVWVNGFQASVDDYGDWEADHVAVSPLGTASLNVQVYTGDPVLIASETVNQPQPATVVLAGYSYVAKLHDYSSPPSWQTFIVNWAYDAGGTYNSSAYDPYPDYPGEYNTHGEGNWPAENLGTPPPDGITWDYFSVNTSFPDDNGGTVNFQRTSQAQVMIAPSGEEQAGVTNVYLILASAMEFSNTVQFLGERPGDVPLPPEWLQINKQSLINTGITNENGSVSGATLISAPAGKLVPLTLTAANSQAYTFNAQAIDMDLQLAVDANRDGNITFDNQDQTSSSQPYRFWLNNNYDGYDSSIDDYDDLDPSTGDDANNTSISCTRDLEDYTRLWINTQGITTELQNGTFLLALEWKNTNGAPAIRLFPAVETNGGSLYLTDEATAQAQTNAPYDNCIVDSYAGQTEISGSLPYIFPTNFWANLSNDQPVAHLLFDAVSRGSGQLVIAIYKNDGVTKIAECPQGLYLNLQDVKEMYQRWTVGSSGSPATTATLMTSPYSYDSTIPADNNFILFVHGWNLAPWARDAFAETAFKRLYWQGYKGHFGAFQWPTGYGFTWESIFTDPDNYDNSESNAWASATGLIGKLNDLIAAYPGHVYLMAHSMGNVVAGEALKQAGSEQLVNTYIAMQGAVPAHCYDPTTANRTTPSEIDCYANYWTNGASCYFNGTVGAGGYINYYNTNDWALGWWASDQDSKPDLGHSYFNSQFYRGTFLQTHLYFPGDTYEVFAYCDAAPCFALGAQANVNEVFAGNQLDLDATYGFGSLHKGHSAEFNSDNMNRASFWNRILIKFGLKEE